MADETKDSIERELDIRRIKKALRLLEEYKEGIKLSQSILQKHLVETVKK